MPSSRGALQAPPTLRRPTCADGVVGKARSPSLHVWDILTRIGLMEHQEGKLRRVRRVIWFLVVVVVLAGAAVIADTFVRGETEELIAAQTAAAFDLDRPPDVEISGVAFLPQLAGGTVGEVRLHAAEATIGDMPLRDVVVELTGVDVDEPHSTREVLFWGTVPLESLPALGESGVELGLADGQVVVEGELLGLPLLVRATPVAEGRAVVVRLDSIEVAGLEVPASDLPAPIAEALEGFRFEIDALPEGMVLDSVAVVGDGFGVVASGTDVPLLP